ncbi:CCD81 protein, partial [Haliaeetus albicilla]|nr:CCD81 protein [Haliaeetus albicilla]
QGVVVAGLGTFAMVQKHLFGTQEVFVVRRPIFQLAIDKFWLEGLECPTEIIPGEEKAVEPLNFQQLSRASGFPRCLVENCVRETILLYSFQLRSGNHFAFAFQDIGILACKGNSLCMQFYSHCITGLESTVSPIALLHS